MRIIVYPHDLNIGGSQLNAIELAAAVRDLGHEVLIFGRRGALNARIDALGVEFIEAPPMGKRPSPSAAAALRDIVDRRGIDVIHGYEWPPTLDATLAVAGRRRPAVMATVMSMSVPRFIPRSVPLVVGTEEIADAERHAGRRRVDVLEPPVDLTHNDVAHDPGVAAFRERFGLHEERITIVSVSRFARELKLEGVLTAIDVVGRMSRTDPVRLVLVGDGPASSEVEGRARRVNDEFGPGTVVLTGRLDDPRPAYAAADISFGMGGSALRALAYGSPLIVQGEHGFWKTLTPHTIEAFLWTGWYGVDGGAEHGVEALESELRPLVRSHALRRQLGAYGLGLVRERFSLERAAALQVAMYERALDRPAPFPLASNVAALGRYGAYYVGKRVRRARGTEAEDDFNARPVTALRRAATT
ncbi:glycosyltransferase family 4 protein [Microbacterium sp. zg.Y625]|uniref:glycosyltransferase family 4 protein n=1 Tax=Microbacterium jiangjiandongii TaxID=3049071 RepID=UPI00214B99C3|nr:MULTISPECIES: glycosyltransferase family 4 protein [unclassified Microbacterium]MCR2793558.1 glycosyltransferase family 4 protein [Microbacterium sp. zg.Y625]WIM25912.1 glycosyltransferase family 4 protein [Microbacterium sp. zg-Y625]